MQSAAGVARGSVGAMAFDPFWFSLLLKIGASAAIVVVAASAAERAGPFWGGLIATLPVSAGPAYVLLAMQSDDAFVAASALNTLAANPATALFLLVFIKLAPRHRTIVSVGCAIAAWFLAVELVRLVEWTSLAATVFSTVIYLGCFRLTRDLPAPDRTDRVPRRWYDLPQRAVMVGLLIGGMLLASQAIGPAATGIVIAFPVVLTSLALITQPRLGGRSAAALMATALRGMLGFAFGLLALHLLAVPAGSAAALLAALGVLLLWQLGILLRRNRFIAAELKAAL
jgi:hypothetical protein